MDYNLLSYFVHEIILARILEWVAISFSGDETHGSAAPALTDRFLTTELYWALFIKYHNCLVKLKKKAEPNSVLAWSLFTKSLAKAPWN